MLSCSFCLSNALGFFPSNYKLAHEVCVKGLALIICFLSTQNHQSSQSFKSVYKTQYLNIKQDKHIMIPSVPVFLQFPPWLFSLNSQEKLHWIFYLLIFSLITLTISSIPPNIIENILPRWWSPAVRYWLVASWLEPLITW